MHTALFYYYNFSVLSTNSKLFAMMQSKAASFYAVCKQKTAHRIERTTRNKFAAFPKTTHRQLLATPCSRNSAIKSPRSRRCQATRFLQKHLRNTPKYVRQTSRRYPNAEKSAGGGRPTDFRPPKPARPEAKGGRLSVHASFHATIRSSGSLSLVTWRNETRRGSDGLNLTRTDLMS